MTSLFVLVLFAHWPIEAAGLTSRADFLLVDRPDVDVLDAGAQRHGIVAAQVTAVLFLSEAAAVEGPGVVAKPLAFLRGSRKGDVVHRHGDNVQLGRGVATIRQGCGWKKEND